MKTCSCNQPGPVNMHDGRSFLVLNWCMGSECRAFPCGHAKDWLKAHKVMPPSPEKAREIRIKCCQPAGTSEVHGVES